MVKSFSLAISAGKAKNLIGLIVTKATRWDSHGSGGTIMKQSNCLPTQQTLQHLQ